MTSSDCWWCFSILGSSFYNSSWVFKFKRNKCHFSEGKWCWLIEAILTWTQWEIQMFALRKQSLPSFELVSCDIAPLKLMWLLWFSAWVDVVWDLEFTERSPLDDTTEEELTASGVEAFRTLYQCLLAHAADQQQHSTGRDRASLVKLI